MPHNLNSITHASINTPGLTVVGIPPCGLSGKIEVG
jgi:hypothetical protein